MLTPSSTVWASSLIKLDRLIQDGHDVVDANQLSFRPDIRQVLSKFGQQKSPRLILHIRLVDPSPARLV